MTQTEPYFAVGDRVFSHYTMQWGTIVEIDRTYRGQTHGVTGSPLPDTTWYTVANDNGTRDSLDDAHGDWDMARIVPPAIAKRYGYGTDPNPTARFICKRCGAESPVGIGYVLRPGESPERAEPEPGCPNPHAAVTV